jgi:hypothetical protein
MSENAVVFLFCRTPPHPIVEPHVQVAQMSMKDENVGEEQVTVLAVI